jgi:hypothetical protein
MERSNEDEYYIVSGTYIPYKGLITELNKFLNKSQFNKLKIEFIKDD